MKKHPNCIDIKTESRLWTLQFEDTEDRNAWYVALVETKGVSITDHAESWHIDRGMPLPPKYTYGSGDDEKMDGMMSNNNRVGEEEKNLKKKVTDAPLIGADSAEYSAESPSLGSLDIEGTETICDLSDVQSKLKLNMDGIRLFEDDALKKEVFYVEMKKDEVVDGRFVNEDVVELAPKLFVNAMDVTEIEEESDQFRQNLMDKTVANDMILDDIVLEMDGDLTEQTPM